MNILKYAMQMEKDGEMFYRQLAEQTNTTGLKTILNMLAGDEVKHFEALERMLKGMPAKMPETTVLSDTKNIFAEMKQSDQDLGLGPETAFRQPQPADVNQIELYRKAQDIEQNSMDFYRQNADQVQNDDQKELFEKLVKEEKKHYFLLENIIEFVSRPGRWLENAEFVHLEEY